MLIENIMLDLLVVSLVVLVLLRAKDLSLLHPMTIYLLYHVFVVTARLISISNGSPTMFDDSIFRRLGYVPISQDEIARAAVYSDIALVASTFGMLFAQQAYKRRQRDVSLASTPPLRVVHVNPHLLLPVLWITFLIGVVGLLVNSIFPGSDGTLLTTLVTEEWRDSSWIFITQMWIGVSLIGFIYYYGSKPILVLLLAAFLAFQLFQGFHRFRIVLPAIQFVALYLLQRGRRWPPMWMLAALVVGILIFFPGKELGRLLQDGATPEAYIETITRYFQGVEDYSMSEFIILDQFANGLTLVDVSGEFRYGSTYLAILTLPIPRQWWPEKPGLADYMRDLATSDRRVDVLGVVITMLGEAYLNFGVAGIVVIPLVLMYGLTRYYYRFRALPYSAAGVLLYVVVLSSLVQVYRDGLTSLILFTVVVNMPLVVGMYLQLLFPKRQLEPASDHEDNQGQRTGMMRRDT